MRKLTIHREELNDYSWSNLCSYKADQIDLLGFHSGEVVFVSESNSKLIYEVEDAYVEDFILRLRLAADANFIYSYKTN